MLDIVRNSLSVRRFCLASGVLAAWLGAVAHDIRGQEAAPPAAAAKIPALDAPKSPFERLIYMPYKNLRSVLDRDQGSVLVPYLEYLDLWERSEGGLRARAVRPPVAAVVTESHYVARIEKDLARIQVRFVIQVLDRPWADVPLQFGEAAIGSVTPIEKPGTKTVAKENGARPAPADGAANGSGIAGRSGEPGDEPSEPVRPKVVPVAQPAPALPEPGAGNVAVGPLLRGIGKGTYALLLPTVGAHEVQIELTTRVRTSPEGRSFDLTIPPVGITTFEVLVPEADQTIDIQPQLVALPVAAAVGQTRIKAGLGATTSVTARWNPKVGTKPDMELLAAVTNGTAVSIADGLVHVDAKLKYQVLRGELSQVLISVPAGHRILDVSSPGARLKGWAAKVQEGKQLVTVELLAPAKTDFEVEVHTERAVPTEPFDAGGLSPEGTVWGIHATGVVRESGQLVVSHAASTSVDVMQQQRLIRIEEGEIAAGLPRGAALAYKFYTPDFRLVLSARPVEPRTTVAHATRFEFRDDELRTTAQLSYEVERAGVFEVALKIPEGLKIDQVVSPAMKEFVVDEAAGTLKVILAQKQLGGFPVTVRGRRELEAGAKQSELRLPLLEPVGAARETGSILVFAPDAVEVVTDEQSTVGAYPESIASVSGAPAGTRLVSAWTYNRRPVELHVRTVRKPTRLAARVGTKVHVRQDVAEVETLLEYLVEHAGVDTFRFSAPAAVSERLQIELAGGPSGAAIKQRSRSEEVVDGWSTWTVVLQQDVVGAVRFRVTYDLPVAVPAPAAVRPAAAVAPPAAGAAPAGKGEPAKKDAVDEDEEEDAEKGQPENKIAVPPPKKADAPKGDAPPKGAEQPKGADPPKAVDAPKPAGDGANVALPPRPGVKLEPIRALGLEVGAGGGEAVPLASLRGEIAVSKDRVLAVVAEVSGKDAEPIDVRELEFLPQEGYLAFRYVTQPAALDVSSSKYEVQGVVETVVSKALVEVLLTRDATATYRCRWSVRSSERQRLSVVLPAHVELLGVYVDRTLVVLEENRDRAAEKDWSAYYVNLADATRADATFVVSLLFRAPLPRRPFVSRGGSLDVPLPHLAGADDGLVAVQELRTVVWVPDEYVLVGTADDFVRAVAPTLRYDWFGSPRRQENGSAIESELDAWFGGDSSLRGLLAFPTAGHATRFDNLGGAERLSVSWWHFPFFAWTLSISVAVIAVVLLRTSWENRFGVLLAAGFLAALVALTHPEWIVYGWGAAQYGTCLLVGLWAVHGLIGPKTASGAGAVRSAGAPLPPASEPAAVGGSETDMPVAAAAGAAPVTSSASSAAATSESGAGEARRLPGGPETRGAPPPIAPSGSSPSTPPVIPPPGDELPPSA